MSKKISKDLAIALVVRCGGTVVDGKVALDNYGREVVIHSVEPPEKCGIKCWAAVDALTRYHGFLLARDGFGPVTRF